MQGAADVFRRIPGLVCVYQIVRLQQNLIVRAVHTVRSVMVAHKIRHPVNERLGIAALPQKVRRQSLSLRLLVLAVGIAVFFPAQGAGDVVKEGGGLQNVACVSSSSPSHWPMVLV